MIINPDEIMQNFPSFSPSNAMSLHRRAVRLSNLGFREQCRSGSFSKAILMCGGSASGKTEYISIANIDEQSSLIYDSTLSSIRQAQAKYWDARRISLPVIVYFIKPQSIEDSFSAFLGRVERILDPEIFLRTHQGSRKTIQYLINNYPRDQIKIKVIESSTTISTGVAYTEVLFEDLLELTEYADEIQLTDPELNAMISYGT